MNAKKLLTIRFSLHLPSVFLEFSSSSSLTLGFGLLGGVFFHWIVVLTAAVAFAPFLFVDFVGAFRSFGS